MPDDATRKLRVSIGGTDYTLRGQATEAHLRAVARHVDSLMQQIASANPRLDERRVAVLTAVNFADEYLRLREEYRDLQVQYRDLHALLDESTKSTLSETNRSQGV